MKYNVTGSACFAHAINVNVEADSEKEAIEKVRENIDEYAFVVDAEYTHCFIDDTAEQLS